MKFRNSLTARIWVPFVLMAVSITVMVGIYIPREQVKTLRSFQSAELQEFVRTLATNIGIALEYDEMTRLNSIISGLTERQNLEFTALMLEEGGKTTLLASNPPNIDLGYIRSFEGSPLLVEAPFVGGPFEGTVYVMGSESFLLSEAERLNLPLQSVTLLVMLGVTLLYFFLNRRVSKPLREVRLVAENIQKGNLDSTIVTESRIWELRSINLALERLRSGLLEQRRTNEQLTRGMESEIQRQTKDLRKTLDELQDSRNLFGSVIESALDAMIIADGQSRIVEWNRKAEIIFGWSREEALGQSISKLIIPHHDRDAHNNGMEHYHATGHGPVLNRSFETKALRRNGEMFDIELYITSVTMGEEEIFSSFIRDITESKQLTQDLERQRELNSELLNGLPLLITLKDRELRYSFVNEQALQLLGQTRENMIGKTEKEVFDTPWVNQSEKRDRNTWKGKSSKAVEFTLNTGNGDQQFLVGRYLLSVGKQEPTQYLLTYGFEISQLKKAQQQLETALQAKDEFLATVSHEIRTPLHSIIVLAELINQPNRQEERDEFAKNIRSSSRHLLDLVNDILDFSKVDAGQLELNPEPLNLLHFIDSLNRVETGHNIKDVEFKKEAIGCENLEVEADRTRLNQILQNLLSNAFKFTEHGMISLKVSGVRHEDRFISRWEIQDTGIGISAEDQKKILVAFQQAHSGISRRFGGTGLGLGIVVKLLDLMGSELRIESVLGKGTTFSFEVEFPINTTNKDKQNLALDRNLTIEGIRMLYVEDMMPNQMVMKAMCRPWKMELTMASSGREAIELCSKRSFDLILLDIQMPEMDGLETIAIMNSKENGVNSAPVHAFTAHAAPEDTKRYLELGFAGVLTKPLTPQQLETFLFEHVNGRLQDRG